MVEEQLFLRIICMSDIAIYIHKFDLSCELANFFLRKCYFFGGCYLLRQKELDKKPTYICFFPQVIFVNSKTFMLK